MKDKNYLQHQKLSGRTRDNPLGNADFDSLASRAQKMSKEDLEDYYISDNANGKTPCSEIILLFKIFVNREFTQKKAHLKVVHSLSVQPDSLSKDQQFF